MKSSSFSSKILRYLCPFIISSFFSHSRGPLSFQLKQPQAISLGGCLTDFLMNLGSNLSMPVGLQQMLDLFPKVGSKWLSSLNITFFQSSTVQFL